MNINCHKTCTCDMCVYADKVLDFMYQVLDSSYSPNITLFISENSQKKLSITVWNIGLRHHNILSWGKSKESYYFSGYRMICYIKRFMLQNILGSEPGHVGWHFINCKPNVMQCSLLLVVAHIGLVLLGHTHHNMALG